MGDRSSGRRRADSGYTARDRRRQLRADELGDPNASSDKRPDNGAVRWFHHSDAGRRLLHRQLPEHGHEQQLQRHTRRLAASAQTPGEERSTGTFFSPLALCSAILTACA